MTEDGILIKEKAKTAKKFGLIVIAMGVAFLAVSFINLDGLTADWIVSMFTGAFFYGGIALLVMGVVLLVLKGFMGKDHETLLDKNKKEMHQRGKVIPFSEISDVELQTTQMMNKQMTAFLYKHNGKRRAIISGTVFTEDTVALTGFMNEVRSLIESK